MIVAREEMLYKGNVGEVRFVESSLDEEWSGVEMWGAGEAGERLGVKWVAPGIEIIDVRRNATLERGIGRGEAVVTIAQVGEKLHIHLADNNLSSQLDNDELRFGLTGSLTAFVEVI